MGEPSPGEPDRHPQGCRDHDHGHADDEHHVVRELRAHLPYSIFSVVLSMAFLAAVDAIGVLNPERAEHVFHVFHPTHILLSAAATVSMFWQFEKKLAKSVVIGILGAGVICEISDVFLPYLGGRVFGMEMEFHVCFFEHPWIVVPFLFVGIFAGIASTQLLTRSTFFNHSGHVLVSTAASLFYLVSFGVTDWLARIGWILVLLVVSVMIPCCLSDIVFPLLFVRGAKRQEFLDEVHRHHD